MFFKDYTMSTLRLIEDKKNDSLNNAIKQISKQTKKECSNIAYQHQSYNSHMSKDIADKYVSCTMQSLLESISLDT